MKLMRIAAVLLGTVSLSVSILGQQLQQRMATVKEAVARNQAALKQYSWTEHTEISIKGEVKKTKDELCRYGPNGQVQKTELGPPAQQKQLRGIRKRVAERKKEELEDYMNRAVALIHSYVPPSPQAMQQAFQAGSVSLSPAPGGIIQLQFKSYVKPGDAMTLTFDSAAKVLRRLTVNSYLDEPKDAVTLEVDFQTLPDGTNYAATTILNASAKQLQVRVQNSNYQRIGG
jgi:hypothetical protein